MDLSGLNIIHLDMDAFYASVEELDNPSLKGKPLVVGGRSKGGIVTTANYEARKFGIHSAMPIFMALQRCKNLIIVPVRHDRYVELSKKVFSILYEITDKVEKLSIDEAFLDISKLNKVPIEVCNYIRDRVKNEIGLTMSFGISYNKFLAKIASDWDKPEGLTVIKRDMIPEILLPLSIGKVYGIGKKSEKRFNNIGVYTVKDLMDLDLDFLIKMLGKSGKDVYERIRGIDNRPVEPFRERKSVGTERTFRPIRNKKVLKNMLKNYAGELEGLLLEKKIRGKTISVKLKYEDFSNHSKSKTLEHYTNSGEEIFRVAVELFDGLPLEKHVRLIGLTVSNLCDDEFVQMCFLK